MKSPRFLIMLAILAILTVSISCTKTGATGPKGETGSANVTYSAWFTPSPYTKDTVFGIWGFNYKQAAPGITQTILDSGLVLTYAKLAGYNALIWPAGQVGQMPVSLTYVQGAQMTDTWSALSTLGTLRIRFVNSNNYWTSISTAHQFRYIIIPGGKQGARRAALSYQEICRQYNIPE